MRPVFDFPHYPRTRKEGTWVSRRITLKLSQSAECCLAISEWPYKGRSVIGGAFHSGRNILQLFQFCLLGCLCGVSG